MGPQAQANLLRGAIQIRRGMKPRVQNHPRGSQNPVARYPQHLRLSDGAVRSADQVLLLAFDPEMRRVIGDIGQNGHERPAGAGPREGLPEGPVVMRDERDHHLRRMIPPVPFEELHLLAVQHADHRCITGMSCAEPRVHPRRSMML